MNANFLKCEQNNANYHVFRQKFKPQKFLEKRKMKTKLWARNLLLTSFLMIPLTFVNDEYIGRPKSTEQKNPFDYIVTLPPTIQVATKKLIIQIDVNYKAWIL